MFTMKEATCPRFDDPDMIRFRVNDHFFPSVSQSFPITWDFMTSFILLQMSIQCFPLIYSIIHLYSFLEDRFLIGFVIIQKPQSITSHQLCTQTHTHTSAYTLDGRKESRVVVNMRHMFYLFSLVSPIPIYLGHAVANFILLQPTDKGVSVLYCGPSIMRLLICINLLLYIDHMESINKASHISFHILTVMGVIET